MDDADAEEGWYCDPYLIHQDRWFSVGRPTDLVRNNGVTSRDAPPATDPPRPLVKMPSADQAPPTDPPGPPDPERTGDGRYVRQAINAIYNPFGRPRSD